MIFRKLENKVIGGDGRKTIQAVREREAVGGEKNGGYWTFAGLCNVEFLSYAPSSKLFTLFKGLYTFSLFDRFLFPFFVLFLCFRRLYF